MLQLGSKPVNIASNSITVANIGNDAGLCQVLFMVGNTTFEHGTLRALRSIADDMRHLARSTFSDHGGMNVHGRTTSADCRHTNNRLEGIPRADLLNMRQFSRTILQLSGKQKIVVSRVR